jgi:cation:H+ antiporter
VQSITQLSAAFQVSEFIISFFVLAIGTSLPELVVDAVAIRKGQFELAIGDAVGSCIVDASVSIGIGQLFFPQIVSGEASLITGLYAIFGSIVVILTLALKETRQKGRSFIHLCLSKGISCHETEERGFQHERNNQTLVKAGLLVS